MRILFPGPSSTCARLVWLSQPAVVDHPPRSNWLRCADARHANGCHLHQKHPDEYGTAHAVPATQNIAPIMDTDKFILARRSLAYIGRHSIRLSGSLTWAHFLSMEMNVHQLHSDNGTLSNMMIS
ncbi:hypothetical protein GGR58DRAFT_127718 [Xylaria digitata]|nr:hypothetical protein GGR58DRAFT_127718 [Xylaria digitata]